MKRILLRAALFLVPASSLFALLPLIASHRLGLGSGGYGLLLAALGLGAIAGALVLPRVRTRLSINTMVTFASGFYALVLAAVALLHDAVPVLVLLIPAGVAWVVVLSTLNASLQLFLPAWVHGRSLAAYTIVLFGSQALGALIFGALADLLGLVQALLWTLDAQSKHTKTVPRGRVYSGGTGAALRVCCGLPGFGPVGHIRRERLSKCVFRVEQLEADRAAADREERFVAVVAAFVADAEAAVCVRQPTGGAEASLAFDPRASSPRPRITGFVHPHKLSAAQGRVGLLRRLLGLDEPELRGASGGVPTSCCAELGQDGRDVVLGRAW